MKLDKTTAGQLAAISVLLPGAVGLSVIVRTLFVYLGTDALASLIVVMMGVGLTVGLVELMLRQRRALALGKEAKALPSPATEEAVDAASPLLRAMLRARVEHAPQPPLAESLTPYLVGLMVMLGLLGTLLGLFETLRGAGHALTESTNVDALRNGLSGPMRGLTRSFGCSAAGVSASAMLGLASVLVRRIEARALSAVHAYATGPLRELSPIRRQLGALDTLAVQGQALPLAAAALTRAAEQLGTLSTRWEAAHRTASEAQQKSILDAVDKIRGELSRTASDAGRALTDSIAPLLKQVVAQTGEAASRHMGATLEALERDLKVRRESDTQLRAALREEMNAMRAFLEGDAKKRGEESDKRLDVVEHAMKRHAEEQAALLALHRDQATAHVQAIEGAARALTTQLSEEAKARRDESSRLLGDLAARLDQAAHDRAQESKDELQAIATLGRTLVDEAKVREEALAARWHALSESTAESVREAQRRDMEHVAALRRELESQNSALAESWSQLAQRMDESSRATRGEIETQNALLAESWSQLAQRVEDTTRATRSEEEARLARLDELAQRIGADLGGVAQRMGTDLGELAKRMGTDLHALTTAMAEQLGARLEREQAQTERTERAMTAMEASAKSLEDALARQELAVQVLLEGGSEQLAKMGSVSQEGAREALAKLAELTEQQATRFAQLEAQLAAQQAAHAKTLADELATQAERLGKGLEGTTTLVHEAAAVLKASSVEMGAVAEMFAKSVDRQREAAQSWLESLGELEGAVERAGRGAAADALGDQLASTQEVFARQLQFQRELFEQLRSLKVAPAPASAREEHDVSA